MWPTESSEHLIHASATCCRYFFIQHHITPQIGRAKAFSFSPEEVAALQVEPPYAQELNQELLDTLKNQTDEVDQCM